MIKVSRIILLITVHVAIAEDVIELNEKGCPIDPTIYKILPHDNCHEFYQCVAGEPIPGTCPDGLMFNQNIQICDWSNQVDCEERILTTTSPSLLDEKSNKAASIICANDESDGLLIPHEYCDHLYMCVRGVPIDVACPEPLLYNADLKLCDWESQVTCGDRPRRNKPEPEDES